MADNYTPDTVEVRAAWLDSFRTDSEGGRCIENGEIQERLLEFDRWHGEVSINLTDAEITKLALDEAEHQMEWSGFIRGMDLTKVERRKIKLAIANGILNVVERLRK